MHHHTPSSIGMALVLSPHAVYVVALQSAFGSKPRAWSTLLLVAHLTDVVGLPPSTLIALLTVVQIVAVIIYIWCRRSGHFVGPDRRAAPGDA